MGSFRSGATAVTRARGPTFHEKGHATVRVGSRLHAPRRHRGALRRRASWWPRWVLCAPEHSATIVGGHLIALLLARSIGLLPRPARLQPRPAGHAPAHVLHHSAARRRRRMLVKGGPGSALPGHRHGTRSSSRTSSASPPRASSIFIPSSDSSVVPSPSWAGVVPAQPTPDSSGRP